MSPNENSRPRKRPANVNPERPARRRLFVSDMTEKRMRIGDFDQSSDPINPGIIHYKFKASKFRAIVYQ